MPADDPRLALRGQRMLVADRPIAAHECVGVYGGALSTEPEFALKYGDRFATRAARRGRGATRRRSDARVARAFRNERPRVDRAPRDERGAPSTPTRVAPSPRPGAEHERYVFRVYFDDVTLVIDPWPAAGDARLMAMNDCRLAPAPALPKAARDRQNVHFKCLFLEGFPFVVAVATRRVEPGDELLVDYGAEFWRKPDLFDERGVAALRSPELVAVHGKLAAALRRGGDA